MTVTPIQNLTDFKEIIKNNNVVIVDFWATWCGPCRMISPIFERLAEGFQGIYFAKVDIDAASDISEEYGIKALPTFMAFKDGQKDEEFRGASPNQLETMIRKYN